VAFYSRNAGSFISERWLFSPGLCIYKVQEFKTRIIELPPGGEIPKCGLSDHVIFYVLTGEAEVTVNSQISTLGERQCLITPPATFSMKTQRGVRIMGIQIVATPVPDGDRECV
jgi:mannose-6-phosphate isomerase-like protein (cupin superfamily)